MYRVTVVDGTTRTGNQAPDGSTYVVVSPGSSYVGATHPCGAWWVTVSNGTLLLPAKAPDGSLYVIESSTIWNSGQQVTVVSGSLSGGASTAGTPIGLLLALTHAA